MKWIKVSERLPEENKQVLFYVEKNLIEGWYEVERNKKGKIISSSFSYLKVFSGCGCCDNSPEKDPTHWAEIEPPKDEE